MAYFKRDSFISNTLRVFYVESNAALNALQCKFEDNKVTAIDEEDTGDGAIVKSTGPGTQIFFESCSVYSNKAEGSGGAILAYKSAVIMNNCEFNANEAGINAGAIYVGKGSKLQLFSSLFKGKCTIFCLLISYCCDCDQLFVL